MIRSRRKRIRDRILITGVSSLGESLRAEYSSGPIRVTVIEPGYIESEMTARTAKTC